MPKIRTIKPETWEDEKFGHLKRDERLLFIGMWNFSDDNGVIKANPTYIKSRIFIYDEDLRINEIKNWLSSLTEARMLIPFEFKGEGYYKIRTFREHQKIDPRYKRIEIPEEIVEQLIKDQQVDKTRRGNDVGSSSSHVGGGGGGGGGGGNGSGGDLSSASPPELLPDLRTEYKFLQKSKKNIYDFIKANNPGFIEPYIDFWNIFADELGFSKVSKINESRNKKFKRRHRDKEFDFPEILRKAKKSRWIMESTTKWFSFDWIFNNDTNYLKVLEGKYQAKDLNQQQTINPMIAKMKAAERRANETAK